jgi:RimJ/RimL family protein N-acetyltransferase
MMGMLVDCAFETDRLVVSDWQESIGTERERAEIVVDMLTPEATKWLPEHWQGEYSIERAAKWIFEIEQEHGGVLVAHRQSSEQVVGLLIVSSMAESSDETIHLGYIISPSHQGQGYATELVRGFVEWARRGSSVESIIAGVAQDHIASRSVLVKSGFEPEASDDPTSSEVRYEIRLGL